MVGADGVSLQGDVAGAYLTAVLSGPRTFLVITRAQWRSSWGPVPEGTDKGDAVVEIHKALYGLPRGDTDWSSEMYAGMHEVGGELIEDVGEESLFVVRKYPPGRQPMFAESVFKRPVLVVVYSDNFCVCGLFKEAVAVHKVLRKRFGFSSESNYHMTDIVGLEREVGMYMGRKALLCHQEQYTRHLVSDYEKRFWQGKELPGSDTPMALKEEDDHMKATATTPFLYEVRSEYAGKLVWLTRGSRYDIAVATKRVAQRLQSWERAEDALTHRILRYLKKFPDLGILYRSADEEDWDRFVVSTKFDADHGNDAFAAKSTSSHITSIVGASTRLPISFGAKGQTAEARNTAEAEVIACDHATFRAALPLAATLEFIVRRSVRILGYGDNDASLIAARRGHSRKLAYVRKYQRVSLSALRRVWVGAQPHERYGLPSDNFLGKVASEFNDSDLGTKPVDKDRHAMLVAKCNLISLSRFRAGL
jgi:hypothetical protein